MTAHRSWRERVVLALGGRAVRWIVQVLTATYRFEVLSGSGYLDALANERRPVVLSFWHNRAILAFGVLHQYFLARGIPLTIVASQSRDGQLVAEVAKPWAVHIVRGSATRGGLLALRGIHRALVRHHSSPIMLPDGPTGPLYHFKIGVAALASVSSIPVLPIGLATSRCWRIKSWDRLFLPRPFAKVVVVIGEPREVEKDLGEEQLEGVRADLEKNLIELTREAEEAAGGPADFAPK